MGISDRTDINPHPKACSTRLSIARDCEQEPVRYLKAYPVNEPVAGIRSLELNSYYRMCIGGVGVCQALKI